MAVVRRQVGKDPAHGLAEKTLRGASLAVPELWDGLVQALARQEK
ncbi:hypothetical protein [Massilia sp. NR 4-1]|nr:hypothetical protein [Massilia sp. NR 4-1]